MSTKSPELIQATQRVNQLFESTGMDVDPFEKTIGVSQGTIKNIRNGRNLASADCIIKIAKHFHISTDYLLCLTNEPKPLENHEVSEISDNAPAIFGEMSDLLSEQRFVDSAKMYRVLPNEYRQEVYAYIRGLIMGLGLPIQQILGRK